MRSKKILIFFRDICQLFFEITNQGLTFAKAGDQRVSREIPLTRMDTHSGNAACRKPAFSRIVDFCPGNVLMPVTFTR